MTSFDDSGERNHRLNGIQRIVQEDYERICNTEDPYVALNLRPDASMSQVGLRYNRYERFYREENFQRLGDPELTRLALEIRRGIERAIIEIQTISGPDYAQDEASHRNVFASAQESSSDSLAFSDIYFRDGLTYMRLGDFDCAYEFFERARRYNPGRNVISAYIAYIAYKRRPDDPRCIEETTRAFERMSTLEPNNVDIYILQARFALGSQQRALALEALAKIEALEPDHPWLARLRARTNTRA